METEKLFYADPFLTEFDARVLACEAVKDGFAVVLDRTAFYPEGGGQPYDTGVLGGAEVLDVHEKAGVITHKCASPLPVGAAVHGKIDRARRFDHMQQHSGEHICSGLICARYGCDNVGFHMGSDVVTIDLNVELDQQQLEELELDANRYLWQDRTVQLLYPTSDELERMDYRSKKAIQGQVRIVTFPGADTCACCGTHVRSTGQVGLIKLLSVQRFRDGVRIELVCGGRALRYVNAMVAQNRHISNLLSTKAAETGRGVERLLEENHQLKARLTAMEDARFRALAEQYTGAGDVLLFEEGLTPDGLRRLCDAVLNVCGGRCACFSGDDAGGYAYAVGQRGGDLRAFSKDMNQALGGRGGGKPDFVQGRVSAGREQIAGYFN